MMDERAAALIAEARAMTRQVRCFDFVPSHYETVYGVLAALPRGRFCEWGSGLGVVTGMAELLGFNATGIELDEELAQTSRDVLARHQLSSPIVTASYFDHFVEADYYFVYCWPGQQQAVEQFFRSFKHPCELLACYGAEDVRRISQQELEPQ